MNIPSWDGAPAGFLNFQNVLKWFSKSQRIDERKYAISKIIPNLSGAARDLTMKWDPDDFENERGVDMFITRLRKSPLCRQARSDPVQAFTRYFEHRRKPGESIGTYLVNEDRVNTEFENAINVLYDEVKHYEFEKKEKEKEKDRDSDFGDQPHSYYEEPPEERDPMRPADDRATFILELLRGWRLLMGTRFDLTEQQNIPEQARLHGSRAGSAIAMERRP